MAGARTFLLALAAAGALCAPPLTLAQGAAWQWLDASGRRVFSDRPPPPDVPDKRILRQPANTWPDAMPRVEPLGQAALQPPAPPPPPPPPTPAVAGQAQRPASASSAALAAAREQAERERVAALRAENCSRARGALATLDSGVRLTTTNTKGEREILDEAGRAAEARRLREIMASDCAAP